MILADVDREGKANAERLRPTRNNILSMLSLATKTARADDSIVFFFSGRGVMRDDAAHIFPYEAKQNAGIALDEIAERLAAGKATAKIMLVDAGLPADDSSDGVVGPLKISLPGIVAIASCSDGQTPVVDEDTGRGLFTLALEEALLAADTSGTNIGSLADSMGKYMGDYCLDRFIVEGQTPVASLDGAEMAFFPPAKEQPAQTQVPAEAEEDDLAELDEVEEISEPVRPKTSPVMAKAPKAAPAQKKTPPARRSDELARPPVVQNAAVAKSGDKRIDNLLVQAEQQFDVGNFDKAFLLFTKAEEYGSTDASNWIGDMYFDGCGVERDYAMSVNYYRQAAEMGLAEAQCNMGYMYYQGLGVTKDYARAQQWLERSAAQDHVDAFYHLYWVYKSDENGGKDEKRAEESINQAINRGVVQRMRTRAEQGWSRECLIYATLFEHAFGVDEDKVMMVTWEKVAAEKGLALAQIYYGNSYFFGSGDLVKSNASSALWYKKAAEQGNSHAQKHPGQLVLPWHDDRQGS